VSNDLSEDPPEPRVCKLEAALGRLRSCPAEQCAFWEPRREPRQGGCVLHEVDLGGRRDVAGWLTELRAELERAETG
jgi:hypothetical protein